MSGPPPSAYIDASNFSEADKDAMRLYSSNPSKFLGPIVIATLLDHILLGMVVVQCWAYFRYFQDSLRTRVVVFFLLFVNLAQSAIAFYSLFTMFGSGFGKWEGTLSNVFFESIMMTEAIAGALSQIFFLERAFALVRRLQSSAAWALVAFSVPAILAGLSLGISSGVVTAVQANIGTDFGDFYLLQHLLVSFKAVTVTTDAVLTGTIVVCLVKSRTGLQSTDNLVFKIIRWVIEAQTLPLIASLFFLAAYADSPESNVCLVPSFCEGKLAALSVLHVLLSRGRDRGGLRSSSDPSISAIPSSLRAQKSRAARKDHTISVSTVTHTRYSTYAEDDGPSISYLRPPTHQVHPLKCSMADEESGEKVEGQDRRVEVESGWPSTTTASGRDLPEIDMIDTSRAPIGEIWEQRIGEEVPAFEDTRW